MPAQRFGRGPTGGSPFCSPTHPQDPGTGIQAIPSTVRLPLSTHWLTQPFFPPIYPDSLAKTILRSTLFSQLSLSCPPLSPAYWYISMFTALHNSTEEGKLVL